MQVHSLAPSRIYKKCLGRLHVALKATIFDCDCANPTPFGGWTQSADPGRAQGRYGAISSGPCHQRCHDRLFDVMALRPRKESQREEFRRELERQG